MRILLVCAGGYSTSVLMKKMEAYWKEQGKELEINAVSIHECDEVHANYDLILLGPQIGYRLDEVRTRANKPCAIIPSVDYALGDCSNIMKLIDKTLIQE